MTDPGTVISVEIHGQRYPIRSTLDQQYVAQLASYVDEKMRAAEDSTPTGDSLRLAVLAALNVADELFRCRDVNRARSGELAQRAGELERLLDRALTASYRFCRFV
jgi:cell division protein ZapA